MKRGKLAWFLCGVLVSALVFSVGSPALAVLPSKIIEVYTGVDIYLDDVKLDPRDVNGNQVEAFVYNGTTYLPVRAVGEAVGKTVQWEGRTNSVYLGKHNGDKPAVWLQDLDYFTGDGWETSISERDNLGQTRTGILKGSNSSGNSNNTYKLNGQYTTLTGTFFQPYDQRSDRENTTLEIYGDGELLYSAEMMGGVEPIDFTVDLRGVLELKVNLITFDGWGHGYGRLSSCGLWT